MVSRAYRKCEEILKGLIQEYGPTAQIGYPIITKRIKEIVGHDPRTIKNYMKSLIEFNMILLRKHRMIAEELYQNHIYGLNWRKVADYKQLTFQEVIDEK